MTALLHLSARPGRPRWPRAASWMGAVLAGGACLLAVGCSAGSSTSSAPARTGQGAHAAPGLAGSAPAVMPGGLALPASPGHRPAIATQSIIYTASLKVATKDINAAAARASQLAIAAGGYVTSENATVDHAHPARASVSLQLKVPVSAYQATLGSLSHLGMTLSQSRRAQDVTQAVANVSSRVTSARAGIRQLRTLLARAGSVSSLLTVQEQINQEEASLEALQAQQRALSHETAFGTISLLFVRTPPPASKHHRITGAAGFTRGLAAGWRALRDAGAWLFTGIGVVLPFAVPVALATVLVYRGRRWWARHRAGASPAG